MDIKITNDGPRGPALEYNVIGGVIDFYFLVGSETDPTAVARQYASVVGTPAEVPYWSFGLHQCRFGYNGELNLALFELPLNLVPRLCRCGKRHLQIRSITNSFGNNVDGYW